LMYVGLDVHKKVCYGTVIDEKGTVVKQAKFTNDHEALDELRAPACNVNIFVSVFSLL